jgi:hypothetical protein
LLLDYRLLISQSYNDIVDILTEGAYLYVPRLHKNFYKLWRPRRLICLKLPPLNLIIYGKPLVNPDMVEFLNNASHVDCSIVRKFAKVNDYRLHLTPTTYTRPC